MLLEREAMTRLSLFPSGSRVLSSSRLFLLILFKLVDMTSQVK